MPISNGRETVVARHRCELAEFPAPSLRPSPRLRGLSPRPRREGVNVTDLQVPSVLTNDPVAATLPPPKPRGLSPQPGRSVTNVTDLQVPSVLTNNPFAPTPPPPKAAGTVPATGSVINECARSSGSIGFDE
ncbi:MAG UNVERIFIED_CONTAM: hypothetical protein LVR18_13975 [Planctomycetaceae bacterium]